MSEPHDRMADAVLALLVADGFEGVSVRRVAATAGVSIGAVQHHFPTKDAMLSAAMTLAAQRFHARLAGRLPPEASAADRLETLAVALISADDRDVSVAWILRMARAAVDETTARRHRADWLQVAEWLEGLIAAAAPNVDAAESATALLALLDGLSCAVAVEPDRVSGALAERLTRAHVRRLVGD